MPPLLAAGPIELVTRAAFEKRLRKSQLASVVEYVTSILPLPPSQLEVQTQLTVLVNLVFSTLMPIYLREG